MKNFHFHFLLLLLSTLLSQSLSDVKPDEFARDCIDTLTGANLIQWCKTGALIDYDPIRLHTNYTTVWESCCQAYDEIHCYEQQGQRFCPQKTFEHLVEYVHEFRDYLSKYFCKDPAYKIDWQEHCQNLSYYALHHDDHHHELELFLPYADDKQIKTCIDFLKNHTKDGANGDNHIEYCRKQTKKDLSKKFTDNIDREIFCCAEYNFIECIVKESNDYCNQTEQSKLIEWSRRIFRWASDHICHHVPYFDHNENENFDNLDSKTEQICQQYGYDLQKNFIGDNSNSSSSKWWLFIPITLVIGAISGAIYYKYKKRR